MENTEENSKKIGKIWKKGKLNREKILKLWKKSKLNSEKIRKYGRIQWKERKNTEENSVEQ